MEIIIYSHPDNSQKDVLLKRISHHTHPLPVMVFDFDGLFRLLKSRLSGQYIVVFLISSDDELKRLGSRRSSLFNTHFIIVVPDSDDLLASKAISLQPRYLARMNHTFNDVCAVLNKMINNSVKI